jgi:hypothetical protein
VEFKATKCWLKSSHSKKVVVEVFKKECYISWLELLNPWLQNVAPRLRKMICGIKLKHVYMYILTTTDKNNLVKCMDLNGDHDLNFCNGCVW